MQTGRRDSRGASQKTCHCDLLFKAFGEKSLNEIAVAAFHLISFLSVALNNAFINVPSGKELYGAGVSYDPTKDQVVVTTVKSGYGVNYSFNDIYNYDPTTGAQKGN